MLKFYLNLFSNMEWVYNYSLSLAMYQTLKNDSSFVKYMLLFVASIQSGGHRFFHLDSFIFHFSKGKLGKRRRQLMPPVRRIGYCVPLLHAFAGIKSLSFFLPSNSTFLQTDTNKHILMYFQQYVLIKFNM